MYITETRSPICFTTYCRSCNRRAIFQYVRSEWLSWAEGDYSYKVEIRQYTCTIQGCGGNTEIENRWESHCTPFSFLKGI